MRGDQALGRHVERVGGEQQVGFVVGEEFEHRGEHPAVGQPRAQDLGRQAGQREQALRPVLVLQQPAERGERERFGIAGGVIGKAGFANDLSASFGAHKAAGAGNTLVGSMPDVSEPVAKRILVVEDNDLNRKLFCDVLRANGFAVEPVADGELVLNAARAFAPDLVLMDIQLPHVSGLDLIAALKADRALAEVPVLAVTAYAGKGDEERIRDAGAADYLAKPVSIGPFMAAVRRLLP